MVHTYSINGVNIALDVNSGAVHLIDGIVFDMLSKTENLENMYSKEDIAEAAEELEKLKAQGMLFTETNFEEAAVMERNTVVKALCLHVAHDCNLKCKYCFAGEGEYKGERGLMSAETGKSAIDFIIKNSGGRRNLEIDFFGGEPLLNFNVVKEIVFYARQQEKKHNKSFRFTLTTNGVLLNDEIEDYIIHNMDNIVLSLDGRKEINDKMRVNAGGGGSYDTVVTKFQRLTKKTDKYYVRGTFTRNNLDFSNDAMHLADLGFKHVSVEPVVLDEKDTNAITHSDLEKIYAEYELLAEKIIKREKDGQGFNFFHFNIDLAGGPCVYKRVAGCGAGSEYLAVTPSGDLYPCHQFVGTGEFKMGNVKDGKISAEELSKKFKKCHVYSKEECGSCFAKFYCSGGCAANAYNTNGDIMKPYGIGCDMQRKRIECAIYIKAVKEGGCFEK